ncbi:MAG: DegT/DnrJ/EryC1/StrS aminotransferase family protein [Bauldia sp.]|nr:DegT/DnrJ/EryC1/StrS aminotransferase family protein [Bauldia sp.]MCW5718054.1 DegT/DnrJ/EryC1/StrS aminotransferase family protein [Bauldia sp.]
MLKDTGTALAEIPFIDLKAQRHRLGDRIEKAIGRVLDHGQFVLGREVEAAEAKLAEFSGAPHVIACANGTDALYLVLLAKGIGPGDAVICPAFTFAAPAEVIALTGATIVFADVLPDTFNIDPAGIVTACAIARQRGLAPKAVIAVDLYGQPADYDVIEPICAEEGLFLLADTAQGFGATYKGRKTGTIGDATGTSFFPAKPLGCYGDGGAIFTADPELDGLLRSIRMHGQGTDRYEHARVGVNSRLDAIQAAILIEKLAIFGEEIEARDRAATRYAEGLADVVTVPTVIHGATSVWAQYTLRLGGRNRDAFISALKADGVPTAVHYPRPLHRQTAYLDQLTAGDSLPVAEQLANEVVSLPMHAYLREETQDRIIASVRRALA